MGKKRNGIKAISLVLASILLCGILLSCGTTQNQTVPASETGDGSTLDQNELTAPLTTENPSGDSAPDDSKTIDIILVAGQSNAVGHTRISDREDAYALAPELETGFSNVLISGDLRYSDVGNPQGFSRRHIYWKKTVLGMGKTGGYMGPEAGMAIELSKYYNAESGRSVGIIKYGHGGTNLLNVTSGSSQYGNRVSPSYAERKNIPYEGATGGLYREFIPTVQKMLQSLKSIGYTDFRILGMYWMQGENDRNSSTADYKEAFLCFAEDIRSDLSDAVKEITGNNDRGSAQMPIWIGTISRTFYSASEEDIAVNTAFINMQKGLPNSRNNLIVVDNSVYDMNRIVNGSNVVVGSDCYHWSQNDHLMIGRNIGKKIMEYYNLSE